jgi:hypothetical protein
VAGKNTRFFFPAAKGFSGIHETTNVMKKRDNAIIKIKKARKRDARIFALRLRFQAAINLLNRNTCLEKLS